MLCCGDCAIAGSTVKFRTKSSINLRTTQTDFRVEDTVTIELSLCAIMSVEIDFFNSLRSAQKYEEFFRCCGSPVWAENMLKSAPYVGVEDLLDIANSNWWILPVNEWKIAFAAHPKIG